LAWLLAGAFLVGAKSRYVADWPWHQFLRGQIICQSVSELAEASRLKRQTILLYLLHNEMRNPLVFRGPYHGAFSQRTKSGKTGFSINVPLEHATALAAGFIVLKVWNGVGVRLLLHDARDEPFSDELSSQLVSRKVEGHQDHEVSGDGSRHLELGVLKLERRLMGDLEVLGQYVKDCKFG